MALNMDAAVRVKASVDGLGEINSLNKALGNTERQAKETGGALGRIKGAAGGLTNALGALVPAVGIAGIAALGKRAIDAADNLNDLSQRTGVAVPILSKFGAAAQDSGSSIDEVAKSLGRLAKGIVDPSSKANEALRSIGISSTDATGKVRSMDAIMLDVADKFSKMPDGAQKTALAMELFGRSGANLIPMLNQGRGALGQYASTIDTEMAQAADKFNDALNGIARSVAGPFNQAITALLPFITQLAQGIAGLAQWFSGLPAPIQGIILAVGALTAAFVLLAPAISAIISIGGALAGVFAGGTIFATIAGYLGAVIPTITAIGSALSGLLPILAAVFTGPVGWIALLVAAGVAIYAFRDQIAAVFQGIGYVLQAAAQGFKSVFIDPITRNLSAMAQGIGQLFQTLGGFLSKPFQAAANAIRGIVNGVIGGVQNAINGAIGGINQLIAAANRALAVLQLPQIPFFPGVSLPRFADGGVVNGPTMALVGEGGEPEYIVPQSKAGGFAANWMPSSARVSIQTGPVTQMNGTNYVTTQDMSRAVQAGVNQTLAMLRNDMGTRRAVGLA
jgi:hypothetical protein